MTYWVSIQFIASNNAQDVGILINHRGTRTSLGRSAWLDARNLGELTNQLRELSSQDKVEVHYYIYIGGPTAKERDWFEKEWVKTMSPSQVVSSLNRIKQVTNRAYEEALDTYYEVREQVRRKQQEIKVLQNSLNSQVKKDMERKTGGL